MLSGKQIIGGTIPFDKDDIVFQNLITANPILAQTGLQNIFPSGKAGFALLASSIYIFEAIYYLTFVTNATSKSIRTGFSYSGTTTAFKYKVSGANFTAVQTNQSDQSVWIDVLTAVNASNAAASTTKGIIKLWGHIITNAGGNFYPQIGFSAAPGAGTNQMDIGTQWAHRYIGPSTMDKLGTWIA